MSITAIVPARIGSQRVPKKNIVPWCETSLIANKVEQLLAVDLIDYVVVNTDSEEIIDAVKHLSGVIFVKRDEKYALSTTEVPDFMYSLFKDIDTETLIYASPMSPFMATEKMTEMIEFYNSHDYDSVVSVGVNKDFYFMDGKPVNFSLDTPPNSQDLQIVNNLTFGCCIIKTEKAIEKKYVVGDNCFFYPCDEIEAVDIDTHFDFIFSEVLCKNLKGDMNEYIFKQ